MTFTFTFMNFTQFVLNHASEFAKFEIHLNLLVSTTPKI